MRLGELIKQYRDKHGLSQRSFAAKCGGITNGYISMIEAERSPRTNKAPRLSLDKLYAIAHGLDLTPHELFKLVDDMPVADDAPGSYVDFSESDDFAPSVVLMPDEQELLDLFRGFNASARADVLRFVRAMAGNPATQKENTTSAMA